MRRRSRLRLGVTLLALAAGVHVASSREPRFFPDDPIWIDNDAALDASGAGEIEDSNAYDFVVNTFGDPGERRDVRAMNVNTLDEVPDSMWFANRLGRRDLSVAEIARGPDRVERISLDGFVVSGDKSSGRQAGFRMINPAEPLGDGRFQTYQIEFDDPSTPEMATGAEVIGTALYHAMGYHVVDVYLAELDPSTLTVAPTARAYDPFLGRRRTMTRTDVDRVLDRAARLPNGNYRVIVSRFAPGQPLGNFRYYGTRPDDPNDIFPHEHRRELRGARVFGAWLNHDDSRGVNSLDMLETIEGRGVVRHYMFDFGSILGSGTYHPQVHRAGNEYILEWAPGWWTLLTLGLYTRPWMHIDYPDVPPSVGRLEYEAFDPLTWKPEYPNPAFENLRADDAFWAARIVSRFSDEAIAAVVRKAAYTDPEATAFVTRAIIERRNKVVRAWLAAVNPLVEFRVEGGRLLFGNAAVTAGVATPAASYDVAFARFDNATGQATPIGEPITAREASVPLPSSAAAIAPGGYLEARIGAIHPDHPVWAQPVIVHLRRTAAGWETVGIARQP